MEIATSDSGSSESEVQFEPQSSQSEVPLEPSHILQLPVELQTNIIERLPLRQDLKNVCLACKELNVVATPMLYRKIDLNLSLVGKKPIKDAFNKDNASLVHVREIRVHDPQDGCKPVDQDSLSSFVNMLAADQLTSFTFETSATISAKFTSILHKKHPRLRNYVLHLTDLKAKTALSPLPTKVDLLGVVRLSLCVGNRVDCERASELLQRAINATTLTIMCTRDATYKSDSAAKVCQDYLKRILGKRRNDKIKRLLLNRMDLSSSACAIASGLRLASLEELLLVRCVNTSQFIGSKQLMQMSLKVFINDCALEQKDDHHGALSAFLSSFDGLQHLRISQKFDSEIYEEFHWSDLESHAKSLQSLLIDDSPCPSEYDSQYAYGQCHERDQMSFHHLLHLCDKLQHLALRVPTPQDLDIDDDEILDEDFWLEFEVPQFMVSIIHRGICAVN